MEETNAPFKKFLNEAVPDGHRHRCYPQVNVLPRAEVDWNESEPNDASGVHRKPDEL